MRGAFFWKVIPAGLHLATLSLNGEGGAWSVLYAGNLSRGGTVLTQKVQTVCAGPLGLAADPAVFCLMRAPGWRLKRHGEP